MCKCKPTERHNDLQSDCVNIKIMCGDDEFMFIRTNKGQLDKIKKALKITIRLYKPSSESFKDIFIEILERKNVDYTEIACDFTMYLQEK